MIGCIDSSQREVTVVGAGIAGLLAAYRLDRAGYRVTLYERESRPGGMIRSTQLTHGISEAAVHSVLATPAVLRLCAELGVELNGVQNRERYIWRGGRLRKRPVSFAALFQAFLRLYFVRSDRHRDPARISIEEWGLRHVGAPIVKYLMNPFLRGIYAARPSELAVGAAFPSLVVPRGHSFFSAWVARKITKRLPSPPRTRGKMMTVRNGMEGLTQALGQHLRNRLGDRLILGHAIQALPCVHNLVLALPPGEAAKLIAADDPALAEALSSVQYAPIISVTCVVPTSSNSNQVRGVGVLVPEAEVTSECLGILFNSSAFADRVKDASQYASFTLLFGGTSRPDALNWSDPEITSKASAELHRLLGINCQGMEIKIHRWERAIPIYSTQLMDTWEAAKQTWCGTRGRVLFANWTGQISVRGMIESSEEIAPLR